MKMSHHVFSISPGDIHLKVRQVLVTKVFYLRTSLKAQFLPVFSG